MANAGDIEQRLREALKSGDRTALLGAARDLLRDDSAEHSTQTLEQRSRLTELGRLVAEMAHELRQPLLGVKAFAQLVEGRADQASYVEDKAGAIVQHARRMEEIIERVLRFARGEQAAPGAASDVNHTIGAAISLLGHAISRAKIRVDTELADGLPAVAIDEVSLQQVVVNLLANARDALTDGGVVRVTTRNTEQGVELVVADDGPGVPADLRDRLFDAFVTGRSDGTGLGLHVVRTIIERCGGSIALVGDEGATFEIVLPVR